MENGRRKYVGLSLLATTYTKEMQHPREESRLKAWLRARPIVVNSIALLIIFVCLVSPALLSWATAAIAPVSGIAKGDILKGVGIVLAALIIAWRARGKMEN